MKRGETISDLDFECCNCRGIFPRIAMGGRHRGANVRKPRCVACEEKMPHRCNLRVKRANDPGHKQRMKILSRKQAEANGYSMLADFVERWTR